jgi:hypothetical protein
MCGRLKETQSATELTTENTVKILWFKAEKGLVQLLPDVDAARVQLHFLDFVGHGGGRHWIKGRILPFARNGCVRI